MATYDIDWDFISQLEGNELKGYQPSDNSGVTIASGFDLKEKDRSFLENMGLPESLINKLVPFFGLSGMEAKAAAPKLVITDGEANLLNEATHSTYADIIAKKYEASTGTLFSDLSREKQTVIASVAFQYGDLETATPNFWKQVTSNDWEGALSNLRNFGDDYNRRRNREADYLIKKKSSVFDIAKYTVQPYTRAIGDGITDAFDNQAEKGKQMLDNQAKKDALVVDGSIPKIITNQYIDEAAKQNIIDQESADTLSKNIGNAVDYVADGVSNTVNYLQNESDKSENTAKQLQELTQSYAQIDKETKQETKDYEAKSAREFISDLEKPQLWNLDYSTPYDREDLDAIQTQKDLIAKELKNKYNYKDATFASYESETIEANIYKQFNKENLAPDPNFRLTEELLNELTEGLPEDFIDEFAHVHSLAHAQQIRQQLLAHLELEDKIYSQGRISGTVLRLMAAFTDPGAWAAIIATDGLLAPYMVVAKSARAYRILRRAGAGAVSIGGIESYLASQRPDLDMDDVMHGVMTGAFLGGLFGIRTPKIQKNNNFTKQFKNGMDESDTKLIRDDGGFVPSNGGTSTTPPRIFNKGDKVIINNKGGTGIIVGFNKLDRKKGNLNDNYIIKLDEKSKITPTEKDNIVLSKEIVDRLNIKNNQVGGANLIPGPDNPNPLKSDGQRTFDWYDPNYDLALHTRKRPDGRFEVKMIENQTGKPDELIMEVRKDGTVEVRRCK